MNATENPHRIRLARLPVSEPTQFRLLPDAAELDALRTEMGLLALRKVRLEGALIADGQRDWRLEAELGATVVQPCSVTLTPVTTRIDTPVLRRYVAGYSAPTEPEAEMPDDDSLEPLPEEIDLQAVLAESLALALPDFPRAEGAELGTAAFSEPGTEPMTDAEVKPFAGLAALKKSMDP